MVTTDMQLSPSCASKQPRAHTHVFCLFSVYNTYTSASAEEEARAAAKQAAEAAQSAAWGAVAERTAPARHHVVDVAHATSDT